MLRPGSARATTTRVARRPGRDALRARHAALVGDRGFRRRARAGRAAGADLRRRLHRLALAPRGVRDRRVRVLPAADDERETRRAADPLADERIPVDDLELGVSSCATSRRRRQLGSRAWTEEKIRLGGMALAERRARARPTPGPCAVRTDDGELKVASGRKQLRGAKVTRPAAARPRPPARRVPAPAADPAGRCRRRGLPFERPVVLGAMVASAVVVRPCAGRRLRPADAGAARRPALARCRPRSRSAAASSPPTTAPSTSRSAPTSTASRAARSTSAAART